MVTSPVASLDMMRRDASQFRWLLFELLRGNYLETRFRRTAYVEVSNKVRRYLVEKEAKEEERQAIAAVAAAEKADPSPSEEVAAKAAMTLGSSSSSASVEDDELQRAMAQSLEDAKNAKRPAEGEDAGAAVKRVKGD